MTQPMKCLRWKFFNRKIVYFCRLLLETKLLFGSWSGWNLPRNNLPSFFSAVACLNILTWCDSETLFWYILEMLYLIKSTSRRIKKPIYQSANSMHFFAQVFWWIILKLAFTVNTHQILPWKWCGCCWGGGCFQRKFLWRCYICHVPQQTQ